ncbi:MAG: rod shape-determining protein MreD [Clostridia bacterium]|nr:rod shape-determining protein MreD [Clostridia bacterium]
MPENQNKKFKRLIFAAVIFLAALIEYTPFIIPIFGTYPSVLLICITVIGVLETDFVAAMYGLFGGILADVYSINGNGFHAITYMLTALILSLLISRVFQRNLVSLCVVGGGSLFFNTLLDALTRSKITNGFITHFINNGFKEFVVDFCLLFPIFAVFIAVGHIKLRVRRPSGIVPKKLKGARQDTHKFKKDY